MSDAVTIGLVKIGGYYSVVEATVPIEQTTVIRLRLTRAEAVQVLKLEMAKRLMMAGPFCKVK